MAGRFGLGSAEFEILVSNDQLLRGFAQSQAQAQAGSKKIADAIKSELAKIEGASAKTAQVTSANLGQIGKAGGGVGAGLKSVFAVGGAVGGITVGLATVHQALSGIVEVSQRAAQAQFALRASYGSSAGAFTKFSKEQGDALKLSEIGLQQSAIAAGTLTRNYSFTNEQIKILIQRSADLAAISGRSVEDTTQRVTAALRGEAEAAEILGLTLNSDAVKATAKMTDAQRKNFETLDQVTKGQILYTELLRQSAFAEGEAKKRSEEGAGAFDRLGVAGENLAKALGETLNPNLQAGALALSGIAEFSTFAIKGIGDLDKQAGDTPGLLRLAGILSPVLGGIRLGAGAGAAFERRIQGGQEDAGPQFGPTPGEVEIGLGVGQAAAQASKLALGQAKIDGEERIKIAKKVAAAALEVQEGVRERAEKARDQAIKRANDQERAELKAIDSVHRAAIAANKAAIDAAERQRDAKIKAVEQAHDAAIEALEDETEAFARAREQEDRVLQDSRSSSDRGIADQRAAQDRAFDAELDAAQASLKAQEEARSRSVQVEIRLLEQRTTAALRGLDQEAEAARDAAQASIRGIEDQQRAEDERHRERMDNLAREEARELGAIDDKLAALDKADRKISEGERDTELQTARSVALRRLSGVRRVGNPFAIAAAEKALADAEAAIEKESASRRRDSARRRLQDQADDIRKEFDAKKRALDNENRERKEAADKEKQRIQDGLEATLEAIGVRKVAIQDQTAADKLAIQERDQAESDAATVAQQRLADEFAARQLARDTDRQAEDRALADSRLAEDRRIADGRAAQDLDIAARREASDLALAADKEAIDTAYNGEGGILTTLRAATESINEEHRLQSESVKEKYDQVREIINATWDAAVARSQQVTKDIEVQLKKQVEDWETWKTGTIDQINAVIDKVNELIKRIEAIPGRDGEAAVRVDAGSQALPNAPVGAGGNLAFGPVVKNASDNSYWTSDGTHGGHPAADIFAPAGSPIYAPVDGNMDSYSVPLGGNAATMAGADGRHYYFAHAKGRMASGAVKRGQQIGEVGNTGNAASTAAHLHFAISQSGAGTFDRFNGSGDVMGDASYWGSGGTGVGTGDGDWTTVTLFGRKYRIFTNGDGGILGDVGVLGGSGPTGMALITAIERLGTGIRNQDFGYAGAAIAHSEGAAGDLTRPGSGGARGPFQFDPGGELPKYAKHLGFPVEQAGDYAGINPMHAANWALRGYLGGFLNQGIDQGIRGAPLADYGSRYGQRPAGDNWKRAGDSFRTLYGYADGALINRRTLLSDYETGAPVGVMAEAGPEGIVTSAEWEQIHSGRQGDVGPINVNVYQRPNEDGYTFARRVVAVLEERQDDARMRR